MTNHQLSYSSSTLLKNCSMKYFHYKVAGTPRDEDADQNEDAFNVGKAFHQVMEDNGHTENSLEALLGKAVLEYNVLPQKGMIHAMLLRYLQVHKKSGLDVVYCELQIVNDIFNGFIDVILKDPETGDWWIGDLKTAGRFYDAKLASLKNDVQLNLYSYFAKEIAPQFNLDINKFKGARYRVTTKSVLKQKKTESYKEHVLRTAKNVKSYDVVIPIEHMDPEGVYKEHRKMYERSMLLRTGEMAPEKNLSYCDSFFRPCEYWSQCHGGLYTKCKDELTMITSENV